MEITKEASLHRRGRFRKITSVAVAGGAIALLVACAGGAPSATPDATSDATTVTDAGPGEAPSTITGTPLEGKVIGVISAGPIEYYTTSQQSAKLAVEALGGTVIEYDSAFDPTKEVANVQAAITQQVDGMIVIPLSTAGTETALNLLADADIPVVMIYGWDTTGAFADKAAGFVQVDFYEYGKLIGEGFKALVPDGPVAIIQGQAGRDEILQASRGFREGYGNDAAIVEEIPANWNRQLAFETTNTIMTAHPDLKGIYVQNDDMAIGAATALGDKISDVIVGSMNGSPEGLDQQRAGTIRVMAQNSIPVESSMAVRILSYAMEGYTTVWSTKPCSPPLRLVEDPNAQDNFTWVPSAALITEGLNTACIG